jgi:endogenous inhibitor of DNA gyrase (YacG/DUF329 family)
MDRVRCPTCAGEVVPRPPSRAFWGLIVSFWAFSLLFGIGAAMTGWSVVLLVGWLLMACTVGVMAQRATSFTCPDCGASVVPAARSPAPRVMTRA